MSTGVTDQFDLLPDTSLVELNTAWLEREAKAALLAAAGFQAMAASFRCNVLEVRIKALICRTLNLGYLPRVCKTHALKERMNFTGLGTEFTDPSDIAEENNWDILTESSAKYPDVLRYRPKSGDSFVQDDQLNLAFDDPQHGVMAWLSRPR